MTVSLEKPHTILPASLSPWVSSSGDCGPRQWNQILPGEAGGRVQVRIEERWIVLQASVRCHAKTSLWRLLRLNSTLPGLPKIVLSSGWIEPVLRMEIPLDDESKVDERVERDLAGFKKAMAAVSPAGADGGSFSEPEASSSRIHPGGGCDLQALCRDAGWSATPRDDASMAVGLEARREGVGYRARVAAHGQGGVRVSVPLVDSDAFSKASRSALGIFMLRASGSLRLARASVEKSDQRWVLALEACFPVAPDPSELNHVFSALSVACGNCGPESAALVGKDAAGRYLQSRGVASLRKYDVHAAGLSANVMAARKSWKGDSHGTSNSSGNSGNGNP